MAVKVELQGTRPGRGVLLVDGRFAAPESVVLALERNDGRFLGLAGVWQTTPHWHPQFGAQPVPGGLRLDLGPEVVDAVVAVGGLPLRLLVRVDGTEHAGVLRIRGELIGSDGAIARPAPHVEPASVQPEPEEPTRIGAPPAFAARAELAAGRPSGGWLGAVLALLIVAAAAVGIAWYLGWLNAGLGSEEAAVAEDAKPETVAEVPPEPPREPAASPAAPVLPEPEPPRPEPHRPQVQPEPPAPALTGIALARDFLSGGSAPDAVFARALEADTSGDCEAALVLYNAAADADPHYAGELARRYDPLTYTPGTCIAEADAPYAIVYLGDAARAEDVSAQRRLGQLMTEREASGPTYEEGVEWLRRAAAAGDAEAQRSLDALGLPSAPARSDPGKP